MTPVLFAQRVLREFDQNIAQQVAIIADGSPLDYAAYKSAVGMLRGLRKAREIITDQFDDEELDQFKLKPRGDD